MQLSARGLWRSHAHARSPALIFPNRYTKSRAQHAITRETDRGRMPADATTGHSRMYVLHVPGGRERTARDLVVKLLESSSRSASSLWAR